jgi:hypothetical protein
VGEEAVVAVVVAVVEVVVVVVAVVTEAVVEEEEVEVVEMPLKTQSHQLQESKRWAHCQKSSMETEPQRTTSLKRSNNTCALIAIGSFKVRLIFLLIWSLIGIGWEMAISDY